MIDCTDEYIKSIVQVNISRGHDFGASVVEGQFPEEWLYGVLPRAGSILVQRGSVRLWEVKALGTLGLGDLV